MGREKEGELERKRREAEEMEERRDPVIKLFGKTIQLRAVREVLVIAREDSGQEKKVLDSCISYLIVNVGLSCFQVSKKWIFDAV